MKVILRSDLDGLGKRGDIVDVAAGHARNFLLPKGHAIPASDGALAQAAKMRPIMELAKEKLGIDAKDLELIGTEGEEVTAINAQGLPGDGVVVVRVAHQVVPADALDGEDSPVAECGNRGMQRGVPMINAVGTGRLETQLRAAFGARHGLGMEAAVERVQVFAFAVGTERECSHTGVGTVVR